MKHVALSTIVALMVLGAPSLALADHDNNDHGNDDHGSQDHRAPEPVTMLGLAIGAIGIGGARWAIQRSKRKP
jgi:hypothetical protein